MQESLEQTVSNLILHSPGCMNRRGQNGPNMFLCVSLGSFYCDWHAEDKIFRVAFLGVPE